MSNTDQNTYTVTLAKDAKVPDYMQLEEMAESIASMAYVFNEKATVIQDRITGNDLTLTLITDEKFAAEVANTAGVASVKKHAHTPCCGGCKP